MTSNPLWQFPKIALVDRFQNRADNTIDLVEMECFVASTVRYDDVYAENGAVKGGHFPAPFLTHLMVVKFN